MKRPRITAMGSLVGLIVAGMVVASCDDATGPEDRPLPSGAVSLDANPPPAPGSFTTSISPSVSNVQVGPTVIGNLADSTYVEVKTTGMLTRYWANNELISQQLRGVSLGSWDARGTYTDCYNSVWMNSALSPTAHYCNQAVGPVNERTTKVVARGDISVKWTKKPPLASTGSCDQNGGLPCHTFTGSLTVTVTPTNDKLRLTASRTDVATGDTVTFTSSTTSGTYTVLAWIWVADTASDPQTAECAAGVTICTVAVYESGTMYVRAKVGAKTEQVGAHVFAGPDEVRIEGIAGLEVKPWLPQGVAGENAAQLKVGVYSSQGQPRPNRTVGLALERVTNSGGHSHTAIDAAAAVSSKGVLSTGSAFTGAGGLDTVTFTAREFGGRVVVIGTSGQATPDSVTITIRVPDLVELPEGSTLNRVGVTTSHPSSHWGIQGMVSALQIVADTFYARYSRELEINDISVQFGGKFDLNAKFRPGGSHAEHRRGTSADIRTHGASPLSSAQKAFLYDFWEHEMGKDVHDETSTSSPHYHFRY